MSFSSFRNNATDKLDALKHLYKCSQDEFKIMPIYQTKNNLLRQIKEKNYR